MDLFDRLVGQHITAGHGHRVAYLDSDIGAVTYHALYAAACRYAAALRSLDVAPSTRAIVVADDSVATVVAVLGLWANRNVPVPVSPLLTDAELSFIAEDCAAGLAHLDGPAARQPDLETLFRTLPTRTGDWTRELLRADSGYPQAQPAAWSTEREVLVQYTSGSTGAPKGVLHGRSGIAAVLDGFGHELRLDPGDVMLSTAKLSFGYGFGNSLLFPLAAGAATVLVRGPVDPHRLVANVRANRATVLCSVPRMYHALTELASRDRAPDLGSLRLAVSAGEHLPAELHARFEDAYGVPLVNGLGATEVLHIVIATRPLRTDRGSTGWAVPGVVATVRDQDGAEVPDGREGRLHIAGPSVARGYHARPALTGATFAEGGAYTGDVVRRGDRGEIRYLCRADDLLNLGGYKVSPLEIETVVRRVPGVADCAVVGCTDDAGLAQAVTYVVPTTGADRDRVRRAVVTAFRRELAPFKRPSQVDILDALPATSTGKLARFKLRTQATSGGRPAEPAAVAPVRVDTTVLSADGEPTLVCVPFAGGTAQAYSHLARHLRGWRLVTGTATYGAGATLDATADAWWHAVSRHVGPGAVVFGHSVGAAVVANIGHRYGHRLAGVRLVISAPPLRPSDTSLASLVHDEERLLDALTAAGLLPESELTRDEMRRLVAPKVVADLRVLRPDWTAEAPGVPVHVLLGLHDPICTPEDVKNVLGGWDLAGVHTVDGGHYFCIANPGRTAQLLAEIAGT